MNKPVPLPTVMPVDSEQWASRLALCNFVNTYYQYRDLQLCGPGRKVLIVGTGAGLEAVVLKSRGYDVLTFDIDTTFNPDEVGSVHDLSRFPDRSFDTVIASHVLEHLAVPYLDTSLAELARVARHAIVYLPVAGRHFQWRTQWDLKGLDLSLIFDLFNYFHKPDGVTPRYCAGQHFWEQGMRGFTAGALRKRFSQQFEVVNAYRNRDWRPSYNWILRSKRVGG